MVDGKPLDAFPADLDLLARVEVEYETMPGWKTSIAACRTYEALPENAKRYVARIEELLGVPGMLCMGGCLYSYRCELLSYNILWQFAGLEWVRRATP